MRGEVNPNGGCPASRAYNAWRADTLHGAPGFKRGAAWTGHIHFRQDIAWVLELLVEIAKRVDDDWALAPRVGQAADAAHPVDADSFEVAKVCAVVQVVHRVHVAPADGYDHFKNQLFDFGDFKFHEQCPKTG